MADGDHEEDGAARGESADVPVWLRATLDDARAVDFESLILESRSADCAEICDQYIAALKSLEDQTELADTPASRVFHLLVAITSMHHKPDRPHEPFGPLWHLADGRRTAMPSDFRQHVDVLADLAARARHPTLRARLCDVCWLLDRTHGQLGLAAVAAYTDIVERTERGELAYRFAPETKGLHLESANLLRRALQIGRGVGWDKPVVAAASKVVGRMSVDASAAGRHAAVRWFCSLDLDYGVSNPAEIGDSVTTMLAKTDDPSSALSAVELWHLAARAYDRAKDEANAYRARSEAAECLVAHATAQDGSAMMKAHFLSSAIRALHGVPDKRDRRTALRHQLIDVQAGVGEEMGTFSESIDLSAIIHEVRRDLDAADDFDRLCLVADLGRSPDLAVLEADAQRMIREHPLSSMFGTAHLDREGKVTTRTQGARLGEGANDSATQHQISQAERFRRQVFIHGRVVPALQIVRDRQHVSDDTFISLLQYSAAVPNGLCATIARGFTCFFHGDHVSATYILTPNLEAILRYLLRNGGHDVTTFDNDTETQKDRTMSQLFDQMRSELNGILTVNIVSDLDRVFLSRPGPALRHAVAHGLLDDGDPYGSDAMYGCWLIYRLCLLPLFAHIAAIRNSRGGELS